MNDIKELIKGTVRFQFYRAGNLYYKTESGFTFTVPVEDVGEATFNAEEKGILMMRYIRKQLILNAAQEVSDAGTPN